MNHYTDCDNLPTCCRNCCHLESDSRDEYSPTFFYCEKNLFMPTKKQTCKKQRRRSVPREVL